MLDNQFAYLYGYVGGTDAKPTAGAQERLADLMEVWRGLENRLDDVLETGVAEFNRRLEREGVPGIIIPAEAAGRTAAR
jgi:hypothetical protein